MANSVLVLGLFTHLGNADAALEDLLAAGYPRSDISAVAANGTTVADFGIEKQSRVGTGTAIGAGFGGALGALLAGFTAIGAVATGGLGLVAVGPVVAALAGAGAGAATGGILGGLIGLGIPEYEVKFYTESLQKGSVLLGVRTVPDDVDRVRGILEKRGATNITTQGCDVSACAAGPVETAEWSKANPLRKLFTEQLCDIYYAEHQLVDALGKLESEANSPELAQAFRDHRAQTHGHIERLEKVFRLIGVKPEQKKCPAIAGIIAEAKELMKLDDTFPQRDAAMICAAQKAEHYEIGTYGCLRTYAETLGLQEAASVLDETLSEEWETDQRLTDLAEAGINHRATQLAAKTS